MFRIVRPGIYYDVPVADYHADPCPTPSFTQSISKVLLERSPLHARLEHPKLTPSVTTDEPERYDSAKVIGDAAHAMMIGRGKAVAIGEFDAWQSKDAKAFRAAALDDGLVAILAKHYERATAMVKAARVQLDAGDHRDAFRAGRGEVVLAWQEDGLWFRSMVDWLDAGLVRPYDLKTTGLCCAPHVVAERPSEQGWDIQGAMIERGLDVLDPGNAGRRQIHFVAQENEAPFALTTVRLSEHDLTMGRKKLAMASGIWRACMASGTWPGYPADTVLSRPRAYLESRFLEREIEHEERRTSGREPMLTDLSGG